ncbi:MAG: aldolase catalytic domain-containing protein [Oligoflexia bacterium]|nr:aldolase catalytic domain-containing protein [Oligoflexia bacterium]
MKTTELLQESGLNSGLMAGLKVLDCTLRDGGYYNSWDFPRPLVERYLRALDSAGVDVIEIGFRTVPRKEFLGPYAFCVDDYLRGLPLPARAQLAVMINAKEYVDDPTATIRRMFAPRAESPISIVRVAANMGEVAKCGKVFEELSRLGYRMVLNIMKVGGMHPTQVAECVRQAREFSALEAIYFADSFGDMRPAQVASVLKLISEEWSGDIGFHSHDNMGNALANSLEAIAGGVKWVDATVLGMGRGAGNVKLETLLLELVKRAGANYQVESLYSLVMDDFEELRQTHHWGPSLMYHLSAAYGIHPTYIQEMLGAEHYDTHQIITAYNLLKNNSRAHQFDRVELLKAMKGFQAGAPGSWNAEGWVGDREVLILGPGSGFKAHREAVIQYIKRRNPFVVCLNTAIDIPKELVDAYAACHYSRVLVEFERYRELRRPILMPLGCLPEQVLEKLDSVHVLDYGMRVEPYRFEAEARGCMIPRLLVAPYALAAVSAGGARDIKFVGFDGYGTGDPRQTEMEAVLSCVRRATPHLQLKALTPSTYSLECGSIYAPEPIEERSAQGAAAAPSTSSTRPPLNQLVELQTLAPEESRQTVIVKRTEVLAAVEESVGWAKPKRS